MSLYEPDDEKRDVVDDLQDASDTVKKANNLRKKGQDLFNKLNPSRPQTGNSPSAQAGSGNHGAGENNNGGAQQTPSNGMTPKGDSGQSTVDAPNSAAWFSYNGVMVIGDHWNQNGFSAVRGMAVGTRVYIDNPDGTTSNYTVTWSGTGVNASTQLLFSDGSNVDGRYGGLVLYTCLSDWQNVAIVCCG